MKLATFLFLVSLFLHAWIGMRDILMDYIKPTGVRLGLEAAVAVAAGRLRGLGPADPVERMNGHSDAQVRCSDRRRRRRGHARVAAAGRGRLQGRGAVQGVSDALAHGGRAGRHRRRARQHGRGQLAVAHVRHHQGLGLSRRPGCDRVHVPHGARGGLRAGALRHAVRPQQGRHRVPAALRRPLAEFRRAAGAAQLLRGRSHRPRHAAHAVSAQRARQHAVLRRVDGARPDPRRQRPGPGRDRAGDGDRRGLHRARARDAVRHRRRRAHLRRQHQRLHQHRRRARHGGPRRHPAGGHGVLAVPPDRRGRRPAC